jgi:DNA-binding NarL/FixJ family response regulator
MGGRQTVTETVLVERPRYLDATTRPGVVGDTRHLVHTPSSALTSRERQVLVLIADGLSTREVARQLSYSERTIKNVLQALTTRLHMRNRTHAVAQALRNGWI